MDTKVEQKTEEGPWLAFWEEAGFMPTLVYNKEEHEAQSKPPFGGKIEWRYVPAALALIAPELAVTNDKLRALNQDLLGTLKRLSDAAKSNLEFDADQRLQDACEDADYVIQKATQP